jgi:hypothetical protein
LFAPLIKITLGASINVLNVQKESFRCNWREDEEGSKETVIIPPEKLLAFWQTK